MYDGHGGVEVAQYAAEKLPSLIKNDLFETGDYENALIKAFLEFDDSLITEAVLARLTEIREESAELEDGKNYILIECISTSMFLILDIL